MKLKPQQHARYLLRRATKLILNQYAQAKTKKDKEDLHHAAYHTAAALVLLKKGKR